MAAVGLVLRGDRACLRYSGCNKSALRVLKKSLKQVFIIDFMYYTKFAQNNLNLPCKNKFINIQAIYLNRSLKK
jgi:hypothetical protein